LQIDNPLLAHIDDGDESHDFNISKETTDEENIVDSIASMKNGLVLVKY